MKNKAIVLIISVLILSMSCSFVAYAGDHDTPILPIGGGSTGSTSDSGSTSGDGNTTTGDGLDTTGSDFVTPSVPIVTIVDISKCKVTGIANKTYNGKAQTQKLTVKYGSKTLVNGTDYKVTYKNNKTVGTATVTITGKGDYNGSVKKTFKINPKGTSFKKVTAGKKAFTATWTKQTTQTKGYQIQYSTSSKFTAKTTNSAWITSNKTAKKTVKKLTGKKKYYVRIRTYKTVSGTKYYSSWSKVKTVTTKK